MRTVVLITALCTALALPGAAAAAKRPDLQVRAVSTPSSQEAPGSLMTASVTVRNRGAATARPSRVGFYLSRDRRKGRGDHRLQPRPRLGSRRPRTRVRLLRTLRVPTAVPPGTYALVACADDTRRVREQRERNNCSYAEGRIRIIERAAPLPTPVPPAAPRPFAFPFLSLTGPPNGTVTFDATPTYSGASQASGTVVARIEAKVDAGAFSTAGVACAGCGTSAAATWTFTPAAPLADGPHTFVFRAIDGFGRSSALITRTLTVDTTPPTFNSISAASGSTSVTATFSEALSCATVNPFDFTATVNGSNVAVNAASCSGSTVTLTLGVAPTAGATVAVTLVDIVADAAGNVAPRPTTRSDPA